jgi:ribosomal protein L16 Arg81 hydroxylase
MKVLPVDIIDQITPEEFHHEYVKVGKPAVLKNYAKDWPAINRWTYDYMRDKAGSQKVKLHGKWQDNDPTAIEMPPVKEVPFSEYLDMLEHNVESDLRIFLFNLFKEVPELKEDFNYPPIMEGYLKDHPYLFFGCAGSDVRLHYDIDMSNVFITQFGGKKRVTLFDQNQSKFLYKLPFTTHSAAELRNIDEVKYPTLKFATGSQCVLNPGDTLFMPGGIWHYMEYLEGSFSLSLRTLNPSSMGKLQGAYNVFVVRKLDEIINKFYKNAWSDFKLKKAIQRADEILAEREAYQNIKKVG